MNLKDLIFEPSVCVSPNSNSNIMPSSMANKKTAASSVANKKTVGSSVANKKTVGSSVPSGGSKLAASSVAAGTALASSTCSSCPPPTVVYSGKDKKLRKAVKGSSLFLLWVCACQLCIMFFTYFFIFVLASAPMGIGKNQTEKEQKLQEEIEQKIDEANVVTLGIADLVLSVIIILVCIGIPLAMWRKIRLAVLILGVFLGLLLIAKSAVNIEEVRRLWTIYDDMWKALRIVTEIMTILVAMATIFCAVVFYIASPKVFEMIEAEEAAEKAAKDAHLAHHRKAHASSLASGSGPKKKAGKAKKAHAGAAKGKAPAASSLPSQGSNPKSAVSASSTLSKPNIKMISGKMDVASTNPKKK